MQFGLELIQYCRKGFITLLLVPAILLATLAISRFPVGVRAQEEDKIARPVDSNKSFERSPFEADYERTWQSLLRVLVDRGFQFRVKDKGLGRFETDYLIFSRHPQFSKLSDGVKSLAKTPRLFLRKWLDGRIRILAEVRRLSPSRTEVVLRPDIYGFSSTLTDDSGVTGEWRQCVSNGKFEFELFNELATVLKSDGSMDLHEATAPRSQRPGSVVKPPTPKVEGFSILVVTSVPEGAEILLDDQLVGMTPSRLTIPGGGHKVVLRRKGYREYKREFLILRNSDLTIAAELEAD